MSGFDFRGFTDRKGRLWFNTFKVNANGDLSGEIAKIECSMAGSRIDTTNTGVLACNLAPLSSSFVGDSLYNIFNPITKPIIAEFNSGCTLLCSIEPLEFSGTFSMFGGAGYLNANLEKLNISFSSGEVEMFEATIEELSCEIYGDNYYSEVDATVEEITGLFCIGSNMSIQLRELTSSFNAIVGINAGLVANIGYVDGEFLTGNHIRAMFDNILANFSGNVPIVANINSDIHDITCDLSGTTQAINALNLTLQNLLIGVSGSSYARSSDDLDMELQRLTAILSGHFSGYSGISAELEKFIAKISGSQEGIASFNMSLENLEYSMLSLNCCMAHCEPSSTITFGDR